MNNSMGEVDALLLDDKNFDRYEFVWIIKMISKRDEVMIKEPGRQ